MAALTGSDDLAKQKRFVGQAYGFDMGAEEARGQKRELKYDDLKAHAQKPARSATAPSAPLGPESAAVSTAGAAAMHCAYRSFGLAATAAAAASRRFALCGPGDEPVAKYQRTERTPRCAVLKSALEAKNDA